MRNQSNESPSPSPRRILGSVEPTPDLMDVIAEIEQRVGQLQTIDLSDPEQFQREQDEQLEELAQRQSCVEANEQEQLRLRDSIVRQQAEIDRLQAELRDREKSVASRESQVDGQVSEVENMRVSLDVARTQLAEQEKASRQLAESQEREQRRLAEYKSFLAQREKEIEVQAEQHRKLRRELVEVAERLAVAEKQNKVDEVKSAVERKAAAERVKELERRCASLEESCKLLKSRRKSTPSEDLAEPVSASRALPLPMRVEAMPRINSLTSVPGLLILMSTVAALACSAWLWLNAGNQIASLWVAGAAYLIPVLGCAAIKHKGLDLGLMLVAIFSVMLGAWFEPWLGVMTEAIALWHLPLEVVPANLVEQLPIVATVLTSMLALSIATGLATNSLEILFRGIFVSAAASSLLLLPGSGVPVVVASVAVWVLLHTMMLVKWAMPDTPRVFGAGRVSETGRPSFD